MKAKLRVIYLCAVLIPLMFSGCRPGGKSIYVSPIGSDHNPGTLKKPFRTITKARDAIRESNKQGGQTSCKVMLREGTYYLTETFLLGNEDTGGDRMNVEFTAYKNEKVTISGSVLLDCNWQFYKDGIYKCRLPELGNKQFSQLFVNGRRQVRARYPNGNSLQPDKDSFIYPLKADDWPHQKIFYDPEAFPANRWQRPHEAVIHIFPHHHWGNLQYRITGINYEDKYISIEQREPQINETFFKTYLREPGTWISERSNYYIDNVFEELDNEGEWYFDIIESVLYYKPAESLDIEGAVFEVPGLKQLVAVIGSPDSPVRNMVFSNIRFTGTSVSYMDSYEYPSLGDWGIVRSGAFFIEGAENVCIKDCFFDAPGGNAVFINNYAKSIEITGNIFTECGESAVCLVGESHLNFDKTYNCKYCGANHLWGWDEPSPQIPSGCIISNNLIHDIGVFGKQVAGVFMSISKMNVISHNHIYNTPRAAICINDGWHGGHYIEFNDVHNTVRETGDHGPFNSWGRERSWCYLQSHGQGVSHPAGDVLADAEHTTVIRNNRFRDNSGWGIDLDDGSSNYHVYNNLCVGVSVKLREGEFRIVENNIFYKGANPPSFHRGYENNHDIFRKNIIIVDTLRYNPTEDINFKGGSTREKVLHFIGMPENSKWVQEIDSNLYNSSSGRFIARLDAGGRNIITGSMDIDLDEWNSLGFDLHSIIADPLFVDPKEGNFKLQKGSPALKIGFIEFPLDQFGLTGEFSNNWAGVPAMAR